MYKSFRKIIKKKISSKILVYLSFKFTSERITAFTCRERHPSLKCKLGFSGPI